MDKMELETLVTSLEMSKKLKEAGVEMVKGFLRYLVCKDGRIFSTYSQKFLKATESSNGYMVVSLSRPGSTRKTKKVHRLVAEQFIPNPNNLPCVNHIDFDKSNNSTDNLEWCSYRHNIKHSMDAGRHSSQKPRWNAIQPRECKRCSIVFTPKKGSQSYCSKLCSNRRNLVKANEVRQGYIKLEDVNN
jgi:hypothetical protein